MSNANSWLCFQIGAREHYVLPRSLHQRGKLAALFTDAWIDPRLPWGAVLGWLSPRLHSRFEPNLNEAQVEHFTKSLLWFEGRRALMGRAGTWDYIITRNRWFQDHVVQQLAKTGLLARGNHGRRIIHATSYAARDIFVAAKNEDHLTVLAQIDPGIMEEDLVYQACLKRRTLMPNWTPAPREYWDNWQEECELADIIVVNSEWSRHGLVSKGIPSNKIVTIPLMYEPTDLSLPDRKHFPNRFDHDNPLTILFLGTLCVRKGIAELFEAVQLLEDAPVRFNLVGQLEVSMPEGIMANSNVHWFGAVPRAKVHEFYRDSHVFILPTLSDGFGLTQLEAQAWGLPAITSRNCGEVVRSDKNGVLLTEASGVTIAQAIELILRDPNQLSRMSLHCKEVLKEFSSEEVLPKYVSAVKEIKK